MPVFPTPYPGELFYSIIARFREWLGYSGTITRTDLFSYSNKVPLILPSNLEQFCGKLPAGSTIDPEYIIKSHSILRIFSPFVIQSRMNLIENAMKSKRYVLVNTIVDGEKGYMSEHLKFCSQCIKQDDNTFGEPYWHIIHQLRGVWYCHIHGTPLLNSTINVIHRTVNRIEALSDKVEQSQEQIIHRTKFIQPLTAIVHNFNWLLSNQEGYLGREVINKRYRILLKEAGLLTKYDYLATDKCCLRLQETFPEYFLKECGFLRDPRYWIYSTINPCKPVSQPLRHIALLVALGSSIEQFVDGFCIEDSNEKPERPLFKCRRLNSDSLKEKRDDYRRRLICLIRLFPEASREQLVRVCQYWYRWLRINDTDWFNSNMPPVRIVQNNTKTKNQDISRFYKKDNLMAKMIKEAAQKLMSMEIPIRITLASLKRETSLTVLSDSRVLENYPYTQRVLEEVKESSESFRLRKMKYKLSKTPPGTRINKSILLRMAGMHSGKVTPLIQEEIDRIVTLLTDEVAACNQNGLFQNTHIGGNDDEQKATDLNAD
ncbi:MAG: TnsD family Tn7-like transposition protein [Sporomusaceae bacterium]|nr:TnsD family Tn7-like transposition protein [Sporomusaceae bacterium]